ncbi:MAG: hypothetical protein CR977_02040 [Gammaproteobacteria bacterium]|nr:MAG: hypothetical protein CR977_02040 [Gammaproteobacteria bacterium]
MVLAEPYRGHCTNRANRTDDICTGRQGFAFGDTALVKCKSSGIARVMAYFASVTQNQRSQQ